MEKSLRVKRFIDKLFVFLINYKTALILLILIIGAQIASGGLFLSYSNITSVIRQSAVMCTLGLGFTLVLASGNLDLSIGHMLGLLSISYALISSHTNMFITIILVLIFGAFCGSINGLLVVKLKLNALILTLATGLVFRGVAYLICGGLSIGNLNKIVLFIGQGILFKYIPITLIYIIVMTIIVALVLYRTKFGRHIIATGGNVVAAKVSGVNTDKVKLITFILMGVFVAIASVIITGRISVAMPNVGEGMEMDAIAAVIIGGTALMGGKANVLGTIFGAFILSIINNLLNLAGVSSFWQWVTKGLIIIAAIYIDVRTETFFGKSKTISN